MFNAENERKLEINKKLDKFIAISKENGSSLRRVYEAIEKGNESIANSITELKKQIFACLLRNFAKNTLKKKPLQLELLKFDY